MKIKLKPLLCAAFAILIAGVPVVKVNADTTTAGITVSPAKQKIILVPGETYTGVIHVSAHADNDIDAGYVVEVGSFSEFGEGDNAKDDYGTVDYISRSSYNQMVDWITLDKTEGVLKPNEDDYVTFTINVPEDAPAGGQYASLIFRDNSNTALAGDGVAIQSIMQILSILYAEVAGETRDEGIVMENNMPSLLLNSPLEASSRVRNNGNVHTDASWTLQVWPLFSDEEICTNEENPYTTLILPETELYHEETCELPSVGIFRAKQVVKIFGEESIVEKTIIVCPIWLLFIIFFAIFALIFYFVSKAKARKESDAKRENKESK